MIWDWPELGLPVPIPKRSTRCQLDTRRGLVSHRSARTAKAAPEVKNQHHAVDDDSSQEQVRATMKRAIQVKQQGHGNKPCKQSKEGGGKLRHRVVILKFHATVLDSSRDIKVRWPKFIASFSSFSRERQSSRNLSARRSPQLVPVTHPGRCRIPMPADPRRRALMQQPRSTNRDKSSSFFAAVSNGSTMEVRALIMRLSHCQRVRSDVVAAGAVLASRLGPLAFSGDKRSRSKTLLRNAAQRTGLANKVLPRQPQKTTSPVSARSHSAVSARAAVVPLLDCPHFPLIDRNS